MNNEEAGRKDPYRVLARKYRPRHFGDLIGQDPMVRTLTNAFESGRIAQAYMLTGVRGVGKTTTARILARALNYQRDGIDNPTIEIETEGEHCRAIMDGRHVDVIEMDAASHTGIDDIRDIIDSVQYAPAIARYKVYIVDEVHMLSRNAFNGLLKTLEEPPQHLKFIFATTEIRKVPVTVLSRCQRFDLRRVDAQLLVEHLSKVAKAENATIDSEALLLIARAAEGSVRDALSVLDQAIAHARGRIEADAVRGMLGLADRARVIDLFEKVMGGDIAGALSEIKAQYDMGAEPIVVMTDLADFLHFVTRLKFISQENGDLALSQAERDRGAAFASTLSVRVLARAWQILTNGLAEIRDSERPLQAADMVLVRLTHVAELPTPDELISRLTNDEPTIALDSDESAGGSVPTAGVTAEHGNAIEQKPLPTRNLHGAPAQRVQAEQQPDIAPDQPRLMTFDDVILLAEAKRDLKIRTILRRNVRLGSIEKGRLEIGLIDGTPADFVSELGAKLTKWTGERWTVIVNRDTDTPTIEEVEKAENGEKIDAARRDPAVEAIIDRFPGARVVDVRIRESTNLVDPEFDPVASGPDED